MFLVLCWLCEWGSRVFYSLQSCHAITRFFIHHAWNPTRPEWSQADHQKPDALSYLSTLYLTRSARLLDSETSGCRKDANKHAPPQVQLQCCLHNRCCLDILAVCLTFRLLSRSFEKEKQGIVWVTKNHCSFTSSSSLRLRLGWKKKSQ